MTQTLLYTLMDLAHSTSQNLGFAHRPDVHVSYGEETITETNLLELRRRHPAIITLRTFARKKESEIGADWEWHIKGRARVFRMRVQAKRLQKDNKLKIPHEVKSSKKQQINLLINAAKKDRFKPVYCIYSTENQRDHWKMQRVSGDQEPFEAGCLLADARKVKSKMPKTLAEIEKDCIPWHYFVARAEYTQASPVSIPGPIGTYLQFVYSDNDVRVVTGTDRSLDDGVAKSFPTIDQLNSKDAPSGSIEGLIEIRDPEYERYRSTAYYEELGIKQVLEINVQEFPDPPTPKDGSNE